MATFRTFEDFVFQEMLSLLVQFHLNLGAVEFAAHVATHPWMVAVNPLVVQKSLLSAETPCTHFTDERS